MPRVVMESQTIDGRPDYEEKKKAYVPRGGC